MSAVYAILIFIIANFSVSESLNDSSSDEIEECPFHFRSQFENESTNMFQFVVHGILLPIVALFGFVSNIISIFIFTRSEMRTPINLILTGKKHFDFLSTKKRFWNKRTSKIRTVLHIFLFTNLALLFAAHVSAVSLKISSKK